MLQEKLDALQAAGATAIEKAQVLETRKQERAAAEEAAATARTAQTNAADELVAARTEVQAAYDQFLQELGGGTPVQSK